MTYHIRLGTASLDKDATNYSDGNETVGSHTASLQNWQKPRDGVNELCACHISLPSCCALSSWRHSDNLYMCKAACSQGNQETALPYVDSREISALAAIVGLLPLTSCQECGQLELAPLSDA